MDGRGELSDAPVFRVSAGALSDGYLSLNTEFEVLACNAKAREQFGLDETDVGGESLWEIRPSYVNTAAQRTLERALMTATQRSFESYSPKREQWVEVRVYPTDDGLTLIISDRSDSPGEHRQELFFEPADEPGVGEWRIDLPEKSLQVSEAVEQIRGLPSDYDLSLEEGIEFYHPEDRPIIRAAVERLRTDGESYDLELREVTDEGEVYWVRTTGVPEYDGDGNVTAMRGVYRDITERKQQELERTGSQIKSERDGTEAIRRLLLQTATEGEIADSFCRLIVTRCDYDAAWVVRSRSTESRDTKEAVWVADHGDVGGVVDGFESGERRVDEATRRALDTDEVVTVTAETADETAVGEWLAAHGLRSVRSVPLIHDGISYGALTVVRRGAGGEVSQQFVDEVAAALAFKQQVHRQRDALVTDTVVECKMRIPADHFLGQLSTAPEISSDATIQAHELHRDDDGLVTYLLKTAAIDGEKLEAATRSIDGVCEARLLTTAGPPVVRVRTKAPTVGTVFQRFGGVLQSVTARNGTVDLSVEFPQRTDIRGVVEVVRETWPTVSVRSRNEHSVGGDRVAAFDGLTQKQEEALRTATVTGFFERPQNATAGDVANILGVSRSTFLHHLRNAEQKVFGDTFGARSRGK